MLKNEGALITTLMISNSIQVFLYVIEMMIDSDDLLRPSSFFDLHLDRVGYV